jgi:hypothetical protein
MKLSGFTLFRHPGKGWQMSTQREGFSGWSVTIIPDEQAAVALSMIEATDGPWRVRAARDVPVGESRAFTDYRSQAEVIFETELSRLGEAFTRLTEAIDGMA